MSSLFLQSIILFLFCKSISCWVGREEVDYEDVAARILNNETIENSDDVLQPKAGITFPGTKWCGPGNTADNYDDLGAEKEADMCCREHDFCPDIIGAFDSKYNLTNYAPYTRENCDCDEKFFKCLHAANTRTANCIGVIYFDGINTKCYRHDYPVVGCKKRGGWLNTKCIEYEYDTNGEKRYQWFDEPEYTY